MKLCKRSRPHHRQVMSGPSRSVSNDADITSISSTSSLVSTSGISSIRDSAVELFLPTAQESSHECTYGTVVTTVTPDSTNTEPYSKEHRYRCFISKKVSTIIELLCLSLALLIVIALFSAPVVYRYWRIVSITTVTCVIICMWVIMTRCLCSIGQVKVSTEKNNTRTLVSMLVYILLACTKGLHIVLKKKTRELSQYKQ